MIREPPVWYSNPTNTTAITAVKAFAAALAARFSPVVGCTRSWGDSGSTYFEVGVLSRFVNDVRFIQES